MAKQRYISDAFWSDPYVETLSTTEKLLFLYFLTNPLCNVAGIYEISDNRVSMESGIKNSDVKKIIQKFVKDEKMLRHGNWVLLVNFGKHQSTNPNIRTGVERIIRELPDEIKALKGFERLSYFTLLNLTLLITPNGDKEIPMFQEPTIELDELGEPIKSSPTKKTFGKYPAKIAKFYCVLVGKTSASRQLPASKEILQLAQKDFPEETIEQWYEEIIGRIKVAKKHYDMEGIKDWNLSKVAENWENILKWNSKLK